jgi:hypothetical protein
MTERQIIQKAPYCDGSHKETSITPVAWTAEKPANPISAVLVKAQSKQATSLGCVSQLSRQNEGPNIEVSAKPVCR